MVNIVLSFSICTAAVLGESILVVQRLCAVVLYTSVVHVILLGSMTTDVEERNTKPRFIWAGLIVSYYLSLSSISPIKK